MTMLSYIILTMVAILGLYQVRDLVKPLPKKQRKKFMLCTILIDLLITIAVIYILNSRSFDGATIYHTLI